MHISCSVPTYLIKTKIIYYYYYFGSRVLMIHVWRTLYYCYRRGTSHRSLPATADHILYDTNRKLSLSFVCIFHILYYIVQYIILPIHRRTCIVLNYRVMIGVDIVVGLASGHVSIYYTYTILAARADKTYIICNKSNARNAYRYYNICMYILYI